jgi:hypothetical protein
LIEKNTETSSKRVFSTGFFVLTDRSGRGKRPRKLPEKLRQRNLPIRDFPKKSQMLRAFRPSCRILVRRFQSTTTPTTTSSASVNQTTVKTPATPLYTLSYFSRFFKFTSQRAYLILGCLLLANGISHGAFAYFYFQDPEGTKVIVGNIARVEYAQEFLATLPQKLGVEPNKS